MSPSGSTLVILAHPNRESSRINSALSNAIADVEGIAMRDLTELYPSNHIDVFSEQKALSDADEIVLQYPTYWYSTPAILKQWMDDVLLKGWAYGTGEAGVLAGKGLRVATTTGGVEDAYAPTGFHGWRFEDVLIPIRATAQRLGMVWNEPFVVHGVREVTDAQLAVYGAQYRALLTRMRPDEAG